MTSVDNFQRRVAAALAGNSGQSASGAVQPSAAAGMESDQTNLMQADEIRGAFVSARAALEEDKARHTGSWWNASVLHKRELLINALFAAFRSGVSHVDLGEVLGASSPFLESDDVLTERRELNDDAIFRERPLFEALARGGMTILGLDTYYFSKADVALVLKEHDVDPAMGVEILDRERIQLAVESVLLLDEDERREAMIVEIERQLCELGLIRKTVESEKPLPSMDELRSAPSIVHRIAGTVLGHGLPDWPDELGTFAERRAYQLGVGHARYVDKVAALSSVSNRMPADEVRQNHVVELRNALRVVLDTTMPSNKAARTAYEAAEQAYVGSFSADEKALVLSAAQAWQKDKAGTGFYQGVEVHSFDAVVRQLGTRLVHQFLSEAIPSKAVASVVRTCSPTHRM